MNQTSVALYLIFFFVKPSILLQLNDDFNFFRSGKCRFAGLPDAGQKMLNSPVLTGFPFSGPDFAVFRPGRNIFFSGPEDRWEPGLSDYVITLF